MCPRRSYPFYIVTYTSWTYSSCKKYRTTNNYCVVNSAKRLEKIRKRLNFFLYIYILVKNSAGAKKRVRCLPGQLCTLEKTQVQKN